MKTISSVIKISLCFCILTSCTIQRSYPIVSHDVKQINSDNLKFLWSKDNVYVVSSTFDTTISASSNRVCFLGGLDISADKTLVCLDEMKGDLLWQTDSGIHSALEVTSNGIFVIYNSIADVRKYDLSGNLVWSKYLNGTGSDYLYVVDNELQILTIPEKFWILDFDGNEISETSGEKIFIRKMDDIFIKSGGIELQKASSGKTVWQFSRLNDVLEMAPLFNNAKIFLRSGQESGSIFALDYKTGELLWKTDNNIISNAVYSSSQNMIYALTHSGELVAINENNGQSKMVAQLSPVPFVLNGEAIIGSYQLAYDASSNILFVSLGDSRQLFAFQEQHP